MKNIIYFMIITLLMLGCNETVQENTNSADVEDSVIANQPALEEVVEWGNTHCPIMENPVKDDGGSTIYEGKLVRFCCPKCIKKFNADPEKYKEILAKYTK